MVRPIAHCVCTTRKWTGKAPKIPAPLTHTHTPPFIIKEPLFIVGRCVYTTQIAKSRSKAKISISSRWASVKLKKKKKNSKSFGGSFKIFKKYYFLRKILRDTYRNWETGLVVGGAESGGPGSPQSNVWAWTWPLKRKRNLMVFFKRGLVKSKEAGDDICNRMSFEPFEDGGGNPTHTHTSGVD
jgi:hypothetical protein